MPIPSIPGFVPSQILLLTLKQTIQPRKSGHSSTAAKQFASSLSQPADVKRFLELLARHGIRPQPIQRVGDLSSETQNCAITLGLVDQGLVVDKFAIVPESQLFGRRVPQRRRRKQHEIATDLIVRDLSEISEDDPIVHIDHGVGHYKGLETITLGEDINEFVVVEYQGDAKLYIPVTNLGVLSRYAGGDPDSVVAHKLGTDRWNKAKRKAAEESSRQGS